MNDFTKEDLDTLRRALKYYLPRRHGESELKIKIQSMIDNYCEHTYCLVGCGGSTSAQCSKCGDLTRVFFNE